MSQHLLLPIASAPQGSQLDSSDDLGPETPKVTRRGLQHFLKRNFTIGLSALLGFTCATLVTAFTRWLSLQLPECQAWSLDCEVSHSVRFLYQNFGTVQGIVTAVYSVGLASLAFSAHTFSEAALWPLLHQQRFTINQVDTYLDAGRGSIPATPSALFTARTLDATLVLLLTSIITLTPLAAAPVVGQVYNRGNMTVEYQGELKTGGGIGVYYAQSNPPGLVRERSTALYTAWQRKFSDEPLPEYRNWFIDRNLMAERGSFTVKTVRIQQDIDCRGWTATPDDRIRGGVRSDHYMTFNTSMPTRKRVNGTVVRKLWQHSPSVHVRDVAKLAVWVHNYTFDHANKTTATLIFAAMGGDIRGGDKTLRMPVNASTTGITSIACDIGVELMEDTMVVGNPSGPAVFINPMTNIQVVGQNRPPDPLYEGKMNEAALWFAVAPVANGAYVYGTQPMYTYKANWIPERYTSTDTGNNGGWTIDYIKNFIRVSTGASMLGEVDKWGFDDDLHPKTVRFPSYYTVVKMDTSKPIFLIILPFIIVGCGSLLMVCNIKMHRRMAIPIMRRATLDEILKSSQTEAILGPAAIDRLDATKPSSLGKLGLRFSEGDDGLWGLYSAKKRS